MKHLARTLLILGSVTACERAHQEPPLPQPQPKPAAIAVPLVDPTGSPAVGNIGQTGAPKTGAPKTVERPRRVQRVVRAATAPRPESAPRAAIEREQIELPRRVPPRNSTRLDFQVETPAGFSLAQERPLVNRRERPAHANMGRRAYMEPRHEVAVEESE